MTDPEIPHDNSVQMFLDYNLKHSDLVSGEFNRDFGLYRKEAVETKIPEFVK